MKIGIYACVGVAISGAPAIIAAQTTTSAAPAVVQAVAIAPPTAGNVLRAGVSVPLRLSEALTTEGKKLRAGQRFQLEVASDVTAGGVTIIPAGSPATGEITEVRNKGMWGKSGRINARVLFTRVNGRQIRLSGALDDKGVTGTAGVVGAVVFIPIAGFFVTGTSAKFPLGTPVNAFLDEDITYELAAAAPPLVVHAPTSVVAIPTAPPAAAPGSPIIPVSATVPKAH